MRSNRPPFPSSRDGAPGSGGQRPHWQRGPGPPWSALRQQAAAAAARSAALGGRLDRLGGRRRRGLRQLLASQHQTVPPLFQRRHRGGRPSVPRAVVRSHRYIFPCPLCLATSDTGRFPGGSKGRIFKKQAGRPMKPCKDAHGNCEMPPVEGSATQPTATGGGESRICESRHQAGGAGRGVRGRNIL